MEPHAESQPLGAELLRSAHGAVLIGNGNAADLLLDPEVVPNIDDLVIEDGKPVESIFVERQLRLATEPLNSSWPGPGQGRQFLVLANVGLFYALGQPPLVPDVMLGLDIEQGDIQLKLNRSYFMWHRGKPPDLVTEIVSDKRGGEASTKLGDYERLGVSYYVIFDPANRLGQGVLRSFHLVAGIYEPLPTNWFGRLGLGLKLWQGTFEKVTATWLRWCDKEGNPIPTGAELAEQQRQRAEQEHQRAEQERQRAEQEHQRAEQERQRADQAFHHAEQERQRTERLAAQLRSLGIEPES